MDARSNLIIAKGNIVTEEISDCVWNPATDRMEITYKNGKTYDYASRNVTWLKNPVSLDPQMYQIRRKGKTFDHVTAIFSFRGGSHEYFHVCFANGVERSYDKKDLEIRKSCLANESAERVFSYLRQVAERVSVQAEDGTAILREQYGKIGFMGEKAFLASAMAFPYTDKNGTVFSSVEDLPIACRKADYTTACSASDLTKAGRVFLRDVLKLREQNVSGISYIVQNSEYESMGKDPTTYILRRNFATHLYTLGFPIEWCQYCMGHLIEDDVLKRSDFNDERILYEMARLLERHPLNETECGPERITIPASGSRRKYILIENTELNDPITVTITCDGGSAEIVAAKSLRSLPQEIDISKAINFPRKRNRGERTSSVD